MYNHVGSCKKNEARAQADKVHIYLVLESTTIDIQFFISIGITPDNQLFKFHKSHKFSCDLKLCFAVSERQLQVTENLN